MRLRALQRHKPQSLKPKLRGLYLIMPLDRCLVRVGKSGEVLIAVPATGVHQEDRLEHREAELSRFQNGIFNPRGNLDGEGWAAY